MGISLNGHVALVTGSSKGLGRQIAMCLGKAGAKVVMNYYNNTPAAGGIRVFRGAFASGDIDIAATVRGG